MLLHLGTDVKTYLDVILLFYFIFVETLFILIHRTSICTDNAGVTFIHLFIEFH